FHVTGVQTCALPISKQKIRIQSTLRSAFFNKLACFLNNIEKLFQFLIISHTNDFNMKKLVLLVFLVSFGALAQDINKTDAAGKRHGLWKGTHEGSKRPRYEGTFDHGKEVGIFKFFDDTKAGTVIATRDFTAKDGSCYTTFFDQKGNKVSEGREFNRQREGEWKL